MPADAPPQPIPPPAHAGQWRFRAGLLTPLTVAGVVLAVGLLVSFGMSRHAAENFARETRVRFEAGAGQALAAMRSRIDDYQAIVLGMQGLFIASEYIDRREFRRYYDNLHGQLRLPGIRALHYTRKLRTEEKAAFVEAVRRDRSIAPGGFPDFAIHPESTRAEHFVIEYIEPLATNRSAFGLDATSQPDNLASFLAARDTGRITATPPFQLIQAAAGERGLVLRAPVYRYGMELQSVGDRRFAFVGLVGISLNAGDIFGDIFTESVLANHCITVNDLEPGSADMPVPRLRLIAEHCRDDASLAHEQDDLSSVTVLPVGGRSWEIRITATREWLAGQHGRTTPALILAAGSVISLLLAALYLALARSRSQARQLATQMTRDLRRSEQRFRAMAEMSSDWFWEQDQDGRFLSIVGAGTGGASAVTPYPLHQVLGKTRWEIFPEALTPSQWQAHRRQLAAREPFHLEYAVRDAQGKLCWLSTSGTPRHDEAGVFLGYHGISHEITVRKQAEVEMASKTRILQATLDNMAQGISVVDANLTMVALNRKFCQILDFPPEMGREGASFESFIRYNAERGEYGPCDVEAKVSEVMELARLSQAHRFKRTRPNGRIVEVTGNPLPDGGFVTTYTDITEQELAAQAIRDSEARLKRAELASLSGNWEFHLDTQLIIVSDGAARLYGVDRTEMSYIEVLPMTLPEYHPLIDSTMRELIDNDRPYDVEFKIRKADTGQIRDIHSMARFDRERRVVFGVIQDITERKRAEAKLQLAASVFTHAREGIIITDTDGTIVDVNATFSEITGYSREEAIGRNPRMLSSGRHGPEFYAAMWQELLTTGRWYGEIWNHRRTGEIYPEILTISAVRDATGKTQNYVALFTDITAIKEHQQQLEHIAHYDALTGLPNRVLLRDRLQQAMTQCQRRDKVLAVVYLDLDGFKPINDQNGHEVGDQLLVAVSQRMKAALREGDTLARLGGDEFVGVLVDLEHPRDCEPVLARLLMAAAAPTTTSAGLVLNVSASIGVTLYPLDASDADQLLRHADQAMYQAKQAGKNRYQLFDLAEDAAVRSQRESVEHIRHALDRMQFVLYYQPKVNMSSGAVIGAEALLRWQHPERGLLLPGTFLPIIGNHPVGIMLGEWVINTALTQMSRWRAAGLEIPVSVNVDAHQLQQADFVPRLGELLAGHPDVPPDWLELEVLETSALEDVAHVSAIMHACRAIGVRFALDDFGTGYSTLTYLKRLPADLLKIDQSFVSNMLDDPDDLAIVQGVIGLAAAFRRRTIAEGVGSAAHGELLLTLGCELAQGYGIAQPMPAEELPDWAARWRPDACWSAWRDRTVNRDDLAVVFAEVEHRHWVRTMELFLAGKRDEPPALDSHQCRFGRWLDTESRSNYGGNPQLPAVIDLHERVHALGRELVALNAQGQTVAARARLADLQVMRDELIARLRILILPDGT